MESLQKLFGGAAALRVMRLFLLNPETIFEAREVARKAAISPSAARTEIKKMVAAKLAIPRSEFRNVQPIGHSGKRAKQKKRRISGFILNGSCVYLPALQMLVGGSDIVSKKQIVSRLSPVGKIKLLVLSGIFLRTGEPGRIDLLIVGDDIHTKKMERALAAIESEIGKELQYAAMETREFQYRLGVYDKFLRDILDYPHEVVLDRIGI